MAPRPDQLLTDPPAEAAEFVDKTKVDAPGGSAIGTSHGPNKFTAPATGEVLDISRIAEFTRPPPTAHLVMHRLQLGSQRMAGHDNQFGGGHPETYACPGGRIQNGIRNRVVRKINIDTTKPRPFTGQPVREAAARIRPTSTPPASKQAGPAYIRRSCLDRYQQSGCAGHQQDQAA